MKTANIIISIAISLFFSCKSQKETAQAPVAPSQPIQSTSGGVLVSDDAKAEALIPEPGAATQSSKEFVYRLIVTFISRGEGTDPTARQTMDTFLKEFQAANGKAIHYEPVAWGREGEADFCFPLVEINSKQQMLIINDLKEKFRNRPLVQFAENEACRHKR